MFETSAEVLIGLSKAFSDYERKNERACPLIPRQRSRNRLGFVHETGGSRQPYSQIETDAKLQGLCS